MEYWQMLLKKGNYSFNQQQWSEAEEIYHQAIECLEESWQEDEDAVSLLFAWISAFHNLAVLYEIQGKSKVAFRYLQIPHQRMTELSLDENVSESLKLVAIRALKITLTPLLAFSKKHKACPSCRESLMKMEADINALQPVLH